MAINFKQVATQETSLCAIMVGRDKLTQDAVISMYPNGITITGFDFATVFSDKTHADSTFAVVTFAEDPTKYVMTGAVMTKVCTAWAAAGAEEGKDIDMVSAELAAEGGVKVKFTRTTTKKGNNLTAVEIL